ncbi:hypothetical protein GCM10011414_07140 [Croceivirga lutea]|uniref:DUF6503 family protein n=1 Tax=Croceivirga lutea TaxID=1775167 RepID=UPI001639725A|nr:DUF6503 family protein [Croceivirga lutea]GGG40204.1 hypothetical protein GCM10011414_07140 [Croceivirga lutea]
MIVRFYFFLLIFLVFTKITAQDISGSELLTKAIAFHDPNNNWSTFNDSFKVVMKTPKGNDRHSTITINLPKQLFNLNVVIADDSYTYAIDKDTCAVTFNGNRSIPENAKEKYGLSCERASMFKNYYTYLYGLPMKLKDPGTTIDEKVVAKNFKGKEYLVLKVTYDKKVGDDTWYFYFDPISYEMKLYQFYHDESKNDGEYILLESLETINDIKMPKIRKWYYNSDDTFLGTDMLSKNL